MKEIVIFEPKKGGQEARLILQQIKEVLNKADANYQIYEVNKELTTEEKWKKDWELASQDKAREKEIAWWDKISDEDDWEDLKKESEWNFS